MSGLRACLAMESGDLPIPLLYVIHLRYCSSPKRMSQAVTNMEKGQPAGLLSYYQVFMLKATDHCSVQTSRSQESGEVSRPYVFCRAHHRITQRPKQGHRDQEAASMFHSVAREQNEYTCQKGGDVWGSAEALSLTF